jgi:hypothetical protein
LLIADEHGRHPATATVSSIEKTLTLKENDARRMMDHKGIAIASRTLWCDLSFKPIPGEDEVALPDFSQSQNHAGTKYLYGDP